MPTVIHWGLLYCANRDSIGVAFAGAIRRGGLAEDQTVGVSHQSVAKCDRKLRG